MYGLSKLEIVESTERALLSANINFFTEFRPANKHFDHTCQIVLTDELTAGTSRLIILMAPKTPFMVEPILIEEDPINETSQSLPCKSISDIIAHLKKLKAFA